MDFFYLDRDIIFIFYLDGDASFFLFRRGHQRFIYSDGDNRVNLIRRNIRFFSIQTGTSGFI